MYLRRRTEGLNEAFCPVCERWLLLAFFKPVSLTSVLSEICADCQQQAEDVTNVTKAL